MYKAGARLGAEFASKLGHLEVVQSENVKKLLAAFEEDIKNLSKENLGSWKTITKDNDASFPYIFSIDGSLAKVQSTGYPLRELAFVKTALFCLSEAALSKIDPQYPHPLELKKVMSKSASYHSTVFPLKNITIKGETIYNSVRKIIYDSFQDPSLNGLVYKTYKWLLYRQWQTTGPERSLGFNCPYLNCSEPIKDGIPTGLDKWPCPHCAQELYCTDVLGFHQEMSEDNASDSLAQAYMLVHETLSLFSAIKHFWENDKNMLKQTLFIKDGPLSLNSQYSKLVPSIRDFLSFAAKQQTPIFLIGQEKTGAFCDHLSMLEKFIPETATNEISYLVLDHGYVRSEVQRIPNRLNEYGIRTNYGEKVYVKLDSHTSIVINVPSFEFKKGDDFPVEEDLIELQKIIKALPKLVSPKYENSLLPIVLANGVASLSSYPSVNILKNFSGLQ